MQNNADIVGRARIEGICGHVACCAYGCTVHCFCIRASIEMVGNRGVLPDICYCAATGDAAQTVQSGNNKRFSQAEQHDQDGYVYGNTVDGVFLGQRAKGRGDSEAVILRRRKPTKDLRKRWITTHTNQ